MKRPSALDSPIALGALASGAAVLFAALVAGCPGPDPQSLATTSSGSSTHVAASTGSTGAGGHGGDDDSSATGTGAGTSTGTGGAGGCKAASDCPALENPCLDPACTAGVCGFTFVADGMPAHRQLVGDCQQLTCHQDGNYTVDMMNVDDPQRHNNPCTTEMCDGTETVSSTVSGTCPTGVCAIDDDSLFTYAGTCVECNVDADCTTANPACDRHGTHKCVPQHCTNDQRDAADGETGVDCGGECGLCPEDEQCNVDADCETGLCLGNMCATCEGSIPCNDGRFCNFDYRCLPVLPDGGFCDADEQCKNGHCVDGMCCNEMCDEVCRACSVAQGAGKDGTCGAVADHFNPRSQCSTACNGSGSCYTGKVIFVTDALFTGDLGGIAGANKLCQGAADILEIPNANWIAWLSDSADPVSARLAQTTDDYLQLDGTLVAHGTAGLIAGGTLGNVYITEKGGTANKAFVWTGTLPNGEASPNSCSSWASADASVSGDTGNSASAGPTWTLAVGQTCDQQAHLYCVQQ